VGVCYNAGARHRVGAVEHRALDAGTQLDFSLVYLGLESSVTQAHIHIGQTSVNGGDRPVLLHEPDTAGQRAGPVPMPKHARIQYRERLAHGSYVTPQAAQGIAAGEFAEVVRALRAGYACANVHTVTFPGHSCRHGCGLQVGRAEARTSDNAPRAAPRFFDKSRRMTAAGQFGPTQDLSLPVRAFNLPM
jgi:hypothetical protein